MRGTMRTHDRLRSVLLLALLVLSGCGTVGSHRLAVRQDTFDKRYDTIKQIVLEEAANHGYSQLTSEVKPSKFTTGKARLYFAVKTGAGTDTFTVEFRPAASGVEVYMHGGGTKADAKGAIRAIAARLQELESGQ